MANAPKIDKGFEKLIEYFVDHESKVDEAISGQTTAKPWLNFAGSKLKTKATEKTEAELGKVFTRDDVNSDYEKARTDATATSNQVAVAKLAGDFLAACERDKRAQWRTRLRTVAHATSRRYGNSKDSGPLRRNTLDYLSRIYLKAKEASSSGS